MKNIALWLSALALFAASPAAARDGRLLVAGSGNPHVRIIDKATGAIEWEHRLGRGQECNSVAVTEDGNVLYSYGRGARLVNREGATIWDFPAAPGTEIQMAGLLPDGGFFVGRCGFPAVIFELGSDGAVRDSITVDLTRWGEISLHGQFRQFIRDDSTGGYIVPVHLHGRLIKVGRDGELLHDWPLGRLRPFSVVRLGNGNYAVPCGDSHCLVEVDGATGAVLSRTDSLAGATLQYVAQTVALPGGGMLICNWGGHSGAAVGSAPQLIETDAAGKVVWTLDQFSVTGNISAVAVLER